MKNRISSENTRENIEKPSRGRSLHALLFLMPVGALLAGSAAPSSPRASVSISPSASWEEILRAGLWAPVPSFRFGAVQVPATEVCADGDLLRTTRAVTFCNVDSSEGCLSWASTSLSTPRAVTAPACASSGDEHGVCSASSKLAARSLPATIRVPVYRVPTADSKLKPLFEKELVLPACS